MAEMIPDSITRHGKATSGEKKVFKILRDALQPDDDHYVWYDTPVSGRYSDFIVFSQDLGIIILEVKDWSIERFKTVNPKTFSGFFYKPDQLVEVPNPLQQVRVYTSRVSNLIKQTKALTQQDGDYKGKPRFPIGRCVVFTNIRREQAKEAGMLDSSIIPSAQALFADDLSFDLDNKADCKVFFQKLKGALAYDHINFDFEPLSYSEIQLLRHILFPEVRIGQQSLLDDEELSIKALDIQQERVAKNIGEGHRILKGVAGSGKSVVLACRAKYLRQVSKDWKILVVCFNLNLLSPLKLHILGSGEDERTDILHFHGLIKKVTNANLTRHNDENEQQYNARIGEQFFDFIQKKQVQKYDAILIDEGQDLSDDWVKCLTQLLNPETNSLLFCYDPAQNVFGRKRPNWKSVGLNVQGKRPTELKECYRNTLQILSLANQFSGKDVVQDEDGDELTSKLIPSTRFCLSGSKPIIKKINYQQDLTNYLVNAISKAKGKGFALRDMAIVFPSEIGAKNRVLQDIQAGLKREFGENAAYAVIRREQKLHLDLAQDSVKIMFIEGCKGLEFPIIFLVGLDIMPRPERDVSAERCLAYVGMTRAQTHLLMLHQEDSGYATEVKNILS
jgi:hypothetical protein